jgi:hypothetical protein
MWRLFNNCFFNKNMNTPFVCRCGESLFLKKIGATKDHLYIIITEPMGVPPETVIVNITTKQADSDTTVILSVGDHPYLKHDSVISYADATKAPAEKLEDAVNCGFFDSSNKFEESIVKKIQEGLLKSKRTPKDIKKYCRELWGITE